MNVYAADDIAPEDRSSSASDNSSSEYLPEEDSPFEDELNPEISFPDNLNPQSGLSLPEDGDESTTNDSPDGEEPVQEAPNEGKEYLLIDEVTEQDIEELSIAMELREIGGEITVRLLYDQNNLPRFILGQSAFGYMILERGTYMSYGGGTGDSPYAGHENEKAYCGGPMCYFTDSASGLYDLLHEEYVYEVYYIEPVTIDEQVAFEYEETTDAQSGGQITDEATSPFSAHAAAISRNSNAIPRSDIIQQYAFGNNEYGTCTAVASGIILNYLDKVVDDSFVPYHLEPSYLGAFL